jgi:hypothetical protein
MKTRLQSLSMLDRALQAIPDDELEALIDGLGEEHRAALVSIAGGEASVLNVRERAQKGRMNGGLEQIALVLTDGCLADCIEQLGDASDDPSAEQLQEVLPGLVERHGLGVTRLTLASALAGEAAAAPVLRDLLKHDELVALPPVESKPVTAVVPVDDPEREAILAARKERKAREQAAARARREQAAGRRH